MERWMCFYLELNWTRESLCWTTSHKTHILYPKDMQSRIQESTWTCISILWELVRNAEYQAITPQLLKQSLKFKKPSGGLYIH